MACGGLPERNKLLMQIYADVTGRESGGRGVEADAGARGRRCSPPSRPARMPAGYDTIVDAARSDGAAPRARPTTDPATRAVYDELYREYVRLHDLFGRGHDPALKTLKRLRLEAIDSSAVADAALALANAPGRPAQDRQQADRDEHDRDEVAAERGARDVDRASQYAQRRVA